jgi:S1-C subfamily serine protease
MKYSFLFFTIVLLNIFLFRFFVSPSPAQQNQKSILTLEQLQSTLVPLIKKTQEYIVKITITQDGRIVGGWSGIYIHKDGYVVTNKHVIDILDSVLAITLSDTTPVEIEHIYMDPIMDLAIIKIKNPAGRVATPALVVSIADTIQQWQFVYALGNVWQQYHGRSSFGTIAGIYSGRYQTDFWFLPGQSGGPLFDIQGRVIGITTATSIVEKEMGFILPLTKEFLDATLESIQKNGKIIKKNLGMLYISEKNSVLIQDIYENGLAKNSWLQVGDLITAIDGRKISDLYPFLYQLASYSAGEIVTMTVVRGGMEKKVRVSIE